MKPGLWIDGSERKASAQKHNPTLYINRVISP